MANKHQPYHWRQLHRLGKLSGPDLIFYAALYRGIAPLQAWRMSDEKRANDGVDKLRLASKRLMERYPDIFGSVLNKNVVRESIAAVAEAVIEDHLRSGNAMVRDSAVRHARAICGMDAPTKTHAVIESPHLDKRALVPVSERFTGEDN